MTELKKQHGECGKGCFVDTAIYEDVKNYYGRILKKTSDLKTNACLTTSQPLLAFIRQALTKVHPEVIARYYGCGVVTPECLRGYRLLDLGCGSGRDCYMLSQLVGEEGHVTGIDMTEEQLAVARRFLEHHMHEFGYKKPNVNFVQGYIEALTEAGLKEQSFDIIISNCVVNLSPDKRRVLSEAYRVLKDGGELYFSDVYCSSRLSDEIKNNKVLWGECLGGALWWEDLVQLAQEVGFAPPRLVTANIIPVDNKELETIIGDYKFVSATYRLFKIPQVSNKGSLVIYRGNITGSEEGLDFDAKYTFKVDEIVDVDAEVASILTHSRFAEEFNFQLPGTRDECDVKKPKVGTVNPFQLVLQLGSASASSGTRGCCGAQPQSSCCK